ncbi:mitochondrial protein [Mycena galericulata]|nr:mitochondrial protein [Mycena galericulata]
MTPISRLVVVGGNGFIGSAICRSALAHGMQVTSVSSSGRPYQTPKGHTPAWVSKVEWVTGDALRPETFARHLDGAGGVVHTLGILLEDAGYKRAAINRDSALRVCEAFLASEPPGSSVRPFVFISAAEVFRPWVPARYIETKRDAETGIAALIAAHSARFRGVYLRPGLVYHAHERPLSTPAAALLDASAALAEQLPGAVREPLRAMVARLPRVSERTESPIASVGNALSTRPLHVDLRACVDGEMEGVVGVREMRN